MKENSDGITITQSNQENISDNIEKNNVEKMKFNKRKSQFSTSKKEFSESEDITEDIYLKKANKTKDVIILT